MRPHLARNLLVVLAVLPAATSVLAQEESDLREFRVGMPVSELPKAGYTGFTCAQDPERKIEGWSGWRACPPDEAGHRAVGFRYDDRTNELARIDEDAAGTYVGGHPVLLALLIGEDARVEGLRIETDPKARLYLRKKAFLFAQQVKARFGEEGWRCVEREPGADEAPVGGMLIKEHCEKTTASRRYVLDRELFRRPGATLRDFVGGTQLTIRRAG